MYLTHSIAELQNQAQEWYVLFVLNLVLLHGSPSVTCGKHRNARTPPVFFLLLDLLVFFFFESRKQTRH